MIVSKKVKTTNIKKHAAVNQKKLATRWSLQKTKTEVKLPDGTTVINIQSD